jgi:PAS domain S-box-containing protein
MPETPGAVPGKILIVDDYPANVKLLEKNLQVAGYQTVSAADGEEALAKVRTEHPDLVLLDVMLPKIDGYEACRRLRADEATAVIPIIMITALKDTEDRIRGLESGADDFISKPFERGELLARVKNLLQIKYYRSMLAEREKFEAVIQDLSHGIIIADGHWRTQTVSRKAAELLGHAGEDLSGWGLEEVLEGFSVEPSLEALRQAQTQSVSVEFTQEESRPPKYLAGRYTRIEGPHGELHNAAIVFRDITETRQKEKLKRDFLSYVSHKLKTPLTIIGGYVDLVKDGKCGPLPGPMVEPIHTIAAKVGELSILIEKLLSYAGLTATELERAGQLVPLDELAGRMRERIEHRYPGRPIEWHVDIAPAFPRARAPQELISIVLDNLVDNAVKFGADPLRIDVSAREIEERWLELTVKDNGRGIRQEYRDQVFVDFHQLEEDFTGNIAGMGLGLATAKRLVASWGGRIDFTSEPDKGAAFFFTMPSEFSPVREPTRTVV